MRALLVIACLMAWANSEINFDEEKYLKAFDEINVDEVLQSDRLVNHYINCFKGTVKNCPAEILKFKEVLPEALQKDCHKCTEFQRRQGRKILDFMLVNKTEAFKELEKIYDPDRIYRIRYAEQLKKEGIVLPD